ncbi:flagellar biosynthetic protein FliO [Paenibacillus sp. 19GGS1-52]|uniref:flagellar biosynthetic protein FliO n=1 Tax=Paenibacillus sp. 19GGS1-52 TaxID=2758563 RepID=UPI001EFAA7F8|nr:flagellar biosynthetic protein FliO [Paenibacillus sp. 19GGS1-52]ULO09712.1 flagellar biosynthetic protein FliO [Paenibacillus sp. 19GGS1-52]
MSLSTNSVPLGGDNALLSLFKVIFVLAVIVVLIVLLIRFLGRRNQTFMSSRSIRTLGAVGLGPNKSMQVIEIGSSLYLIGVGENISILDKVIDPTEVALIISAFENPSSGQNNILAPLIAKIKGKLRGEIPSQEIELSETSSFYETLQSKLRTAPERKEKLEELLRDDASKVESRDL